MVKSVAVVAGLALAAAAQAQYTSDFEAPLYNGSTAGTLLTGQDGWYLPAVAGSQDATVHLYAGNVYGFVQNPTGGSQFAVTRFGNANSARGQHAFNFQANTVYTAAYDFCANRFGGALPASNNIGSFSLQPSATNRFFQSLFVWDDLNTGNALDANYVYFDSNGVQNNASGLTPGPEWNALNLNTWYRMSTTFDFATNKILAISIDNLHDAAPATVLDTSGLGWYMAGGANPTQPLPTDFRIFGSGAGSNVNQVGWDNISITAVPAPGALALIGLGGLVAARRRRA
jgi:MYXO-CTERM domain-containing protein